MVMSQRHDDHGPTISRRSLLKGAGLAAGVAAAGLAVDRLSASSSNPAGRWRVPAEHVRHERTWMAWPSSTAIWGGKLLPGLQGDVATIAREIAEHEPVIICADGPAAAASARTACGPSVSVIDSIPVNDCWMRDTGPLFRVDGAGGRDAFGLNFDGWGGDQIHGKDRGVAARVASNAGVSPFQRAAVVGEGGGIEYDGEGTLMATESCWVDPNRNPGLTRAEVESELLDRFGATKMIWCPGIRGRDITDDHIDATSRFVRPGVVMVQLPPPGRTDVWAENARRQHEVLSKATDAAGRRLQVLVVEGPRALPRWPRRRWGTFVDSYVNWALTNGSVITTQFGDTARDAAARSAIGAAFPDRKVVQLNLDQLYGEGGGGAHCVTMQEPLA